MRENECTEFGCRLEQPKKSLYEGVARHDADQKRIASLQSDLDSAVAVLAEKERRIGELEPDAEAYRRLCDIRKKHPGIPCACEFDDDNADQVLSWCNFHAEMRDRIAELEAKLANQAKAIAKYQQITDEQRKKIHDLTIP